MSRLQSSSHSPVSQCQSRKSAVSPVSALLRLITHRCHVLCKCSTKACCTMSCPHRCHRHVARLQVRHPHYYLPYQVPSSQSCLHHSMGRCTQHSVYVNVSETSSEDVVDFATEEASTEEEPLLPPQLPEHQVSHTCALSA